MIVRITHVTDQAGRYKGWYHMELPGGRAIETPRHRGGRRFLLATVAEEFRDQTVTVLFPRGKRRETVRPGHEWRRYYA